MTSYAVELTDAALVAIIEQARYIAIEGRAPENAERWLRAGVGRCRLAREVASARSGWVPRLHLGVIHGAPVSTSIHFLHHTGCRDVFCWVQAQGKAGLLPRAVEANPR